MDLYSKALIATSIFNLFALWRLIRYRLHRELPALVGFLSFQLLSTLALVVSTRTPQSRRYQTLYEITEPLNWIFYLLIVWEMYNLVFASYPGIATLARWATYSSAAVATLLSIYMAVHAWLQHHGTLRIFGYVEFWERCVSFALTIFIVLMMISLARYPLKIAWNTRSSIGVFTLYFTGVFTFLALGAVETPIALRLRTYGLFALSCICYAAWGVLLRDPASERAVRSEVETDHYEESRLLDELRSIDSILVKSARH